MSEPKKPLTHILGFAFEAKFGPFTLSVPTTAEFLSTTIQPHGEATMCFTCVDPQSVPSKDRKFVALSTGSERETL